MFFMLLFPKSGRLVTYTSFSVPLVSDIVCLFVVVVVIGFLGFINKVNFWFVLLFLVSGCRLIPSVGNDESLLVSFEFDVLWNSMMC